MLALVVLGFGAAPGGASAEPGRRPEAGSGALTLVAAAGAARQVAGGPGETDPSVGAALEVGLGLDLGARLRLSLTGAYLPEVAQPDRVDRGLWRIGPSLRLFLAGPSREAGPWVGLGTGLGATTDAARPYARADLGWAFGRAAQVGLVASAIRELDALADGGTFVALALRFDGVLPGPWSPSRAHVARAAPRPAPRVEADTDLPAGVPLDPEIVRGEIRDNQDDVATCIALARRHGEAPPRRVDLALVILPAGRVHEADVAGGGDDLETCLETRARRWTFPMAQGTTRFRAPFVLP